MHQHEAGAQNYGVLIMHVHIEQDIDNIKTAHIKDQFIVIPAEVSGMKICFETWFAQQMARYDNTDTITYSYSQDVRWT